MNILDENVLTALNLSIDGIFIENTSGDILMCNKAGAEMFGYTATELVHFDPNDPKNRVSAQSTAHRRKDEEQIKLVLHDSVEKEKFVVPLKTVEYMETNLRKLNLHLTNGTVLESYDTLNQIQQVLIPEGSFLRCHHSFIVNLQCAELDEHLLVFVMHSGARIPIRKKQYPQLKQAYYNYKILMQ